MEGDKMSIQKTTQVVIPYAGKTSFAFDHAKKRSIQYLQNTGMINQIENIPSRYPAVSGLLSHTDIAVRAKLLKAHLEDAFENNTFSVNITRRKASPVLSITHDCTSEMVGKIVQLYVDDTTRYKITKL
jgi:hypothetical protein